MTNPQQNTPAGQCVTQASPAKILASMKDPWKIQKTQFGAVQRGYYRMPAIRSRVEKRCWEKSGHKLCKAEAQAGIKIARRNINNLRYADDTKLRAESEELKSLMKVKEESKKAGLKFNIQKTKIMASSPITSWQINGEAVGTVTDCFLGFQNHCTFCDYSHETKRHLQIGSYDQHRQHIRKQKHHFTNKGVSSQSYGFSSSHV